MAGSNKRLSNGLFKISRNKAQKSQKEKISHKATKKRPRPEKHYINVPDKQDADLYFRIKHKGHKVWKR